MNYLFILFVFPFLAWGQNQVAIRATMVPHSATFTAKSEKLKGRLLKQQNTFSADRLSVFVDSFTTENKLRDQHFVQYLAGGEKLPHPRIDLIKLKAREGKGRGEIIINGVAKEVEISYQEKGDEVHAEFTVTPSHFKLPPANYLGIGVEDQVKVKVQIKYEIK